MRLAFAVTTYKESNEKVLASLGRFYSDAAVLIFDDAKEHLKSFQFGGAWTDRYLRAFLATDAEVLIKLDPDTAVLRAAKDFPTSNIFGSIVDGFVLGGAVGYSRAGVRKIVDSGLLSDAKYKTEEYAYEWRAGGLVSCQDKIMKDIIQRLSLSTASWSDVCVRRSHPDSTMPTGDFAFVHPDARK